MLFSGTWTIRLNRMHSYLSDNLRAYGTDCCAVYPPTDLQLPVPSEPATDLQLVTKCYETNLTYPSDIEAETQIQIDIEIPGPGGSTSTQLHKPCVGYSLHSLMIFNMHCGYLEMCNITYFLVWYGHSDIKLF